MEENMKLALSMETHYDSIEIELTEIKQVFYTHWIVGNDSRQRAYTVQNVIGFKMCTLYRSSLTGKMHQWNKNVWFVGR